MLTPFWSIQPLYEANPGTACERRGFHTVSWFTANTSDPPPPAAFCQDCGVRAVISRESEIASAIEADNER